MKSLAFLFALMTAALVTPLWAQSTVTTTTTAPAYSSSAHQAVEVAKDGVDAGMRNYLVSVYGVGTPTAIQTWWVIFYDPAVSSHGRAVKVENGQIVKSYDARGGVTYHHDLVFPRSQVSNEAGALGAAETYAGQHAIAYDRVRVLLRVTAAHQELRWRVQLLDAGASKGFVFSNAADGSFAMYAPPGSVPSGSGTGGVVGDAKAAGNDVKNTFLGIGGDLQEFFTGDRTVDQ